MTAALITPPRLRTFGAGTDKLNHPVDTLGRARFRATLEHGSVHVTRSADTSAAIPFRGTSILFNKRAWIGTRDGGFWEQIAPQAVVKTLQEADVRLLQNHNPDLLLARTNPVMRAEGTATLTLTSTYAGVVTEADMAPVSYAQDLAILLERGDISQMSFAFDPLEWIRETLPDGTLLITLTELRLYDVSIVTYPAYEETDAGLRAAAFDAMCRSNGYDPDAVARGFLIGGEMPDAFLKPTVRATPPTPDPQTLKRARLSGSQSRSLNGWTLSDLWPLLDDAVVDACSSPDFNAYWYVWIVDVSDTWLVYYDSRPGAADCAYFQVDYTVDADGHVTLGTPVEVVPKTTYIPAVDETDEGPEAPIGEPDDAQEMSAGPATATRATNSPPATTTGDEEAADQARADRMRELRFSELAQPKE